MMPTLTSYRAYKRGIMSGLRKPLLLTSCSLCGVFWLKAANSNVEHVEAVVLGLSLLIVTLPALATSPRAVLLSATMGSGAASCLIALIAMGYMPLPKGKYRASARLQPRFHLQHPSRIYSKHPCTTCLPIALCAFRLLTWLPLPTWPFVACHVIMSASYGALLQGQSSWHLLAKNSG